MPKNEFKIQDIATVFLVRELEARHKVVTPKFEVNQRSEHKLMFTCNCGGTDHHICFDWWDDNECAEYWVTVVDPSTPNLWERICNACAHVFKNEPIYHAELGLNSNDLNRLKSHMHEYAKSLTKRNISYKVSD